jgi:hypothetical protein
VRLKNAPSKSLHQETENFETHKTAELTEEDPYDIHKNLQLLVLPLMGPLEDENDLGFCNLH